MPLQTAAGCPFSAYTIKKCSSGSGYATALKIWRPLAKQGNVSAQFNLGTMYVEGKGLQKDYAEAVRWFRKAAEQGHAAAQFNLGGAYLNGWGMPENQTLALMWLTIAKAHGHENATTAISVVTQSMGSEQITEAEHMARDWMAKHQP